MLVRRRPSTTQNRKAEPSLSLKSEVRPTGTTKNRPTAKTSATSIVPAHMPPEIGSSSSSSCALAAMLRALKPILSDSTSATTPRMTGQRSARWRLVQETSGNDCTSISPSGLRTPTAHVETPRIITPSSTACPPTGASRCACSAGRGGAAVSVLTCIGSAAGPASWSLGAGALPLGGAALEALDATAGVDQLLLARVERVAVRADLHVHVALGRAGRERVPARARHGRLDVLGMDFGLHDVVHCRCRCTSVI